MKRQSKKLAKQTDKEIAAQSLADEHERHNPLADELRDANMAMLDRLHELLFDPLWVCGPDGFVHDDGSTKSRRATDAESREFTIESYCDAFRVNLYGDISAQVVAWLRAQIKLHQAAIRRVVAAGKRGELKGVRAKRKAVK